MEAHSWKWIYNEQKIQQSNNKLQTGITTKSITACSTALHGCEGWTMKKQDRNSICAFEFWCWQRLKTNMDHKENKLVNSCSNQGWTFPHSINDQTHFGQIIKRSSARQKISAFCFEKLKINEQDYKTRLSQSTLKWKCHWEAWSLGEETAFGRNAAHMGICNQQSLDSIYWWRSVSKPVAVRIKCLKMINLNSN